MKTPIMRFRQVGQHSKFRLLKWSLLFALLFSQFALASHHHDDAQDLAKQLQHHDCSTCSNLHSLDHSTHSQTNFNFAPLSTAKEFPEIFSRSSSVKFRHTQPRAPPIR